MRVRYLIFHWTSVHARHGTRAQKLLQLVANVATWCLYSKEVRHFCFFAVSRPRCLGTIMCVCVFVCVFLSYYYYSIIYFISARRAQKLCTVGLPHTWCWICQNLDFVFPLFCFCLFLGILLLLLLLLFSGDVFVGNLPKNPACINFLGSAITHTHTHTHARARNNTKQVKNQKQKQKQKQKNNINKRTKI